MVIVAGVSIGLEFFVAHILISIKCIQISFFQLIHNMSRWFTCKIKLQNLTTFFISSYHTNTL